MSQKSWKDQKPMLEVEIHPKPALDENRAGRGTEGKGMGTEGKLAGDTRKEQEQRVKYHSSGTGVAL